MKSKELAQRFGFSDRYIRKLTKKALSDGLSFIEINGERYVFCLIDGIGKKGKLYNYEKILPAPLKKRKRGVSKVLVSEVPKIDLKNPTLEQKVAVCKYYKWHNISLRAFAEVLNQENGGYFKVDTIQKRLKRWYEAYSKGGKEALRDKRGGRDSKVEWELFLMSLVQNAHLYTYYSRYCYLWCKKYNKVYDVFNPTSNISYEGFKNYFNKHKNEQVVKAFLSGRDAIDELVPVFNSKKYIDYPNERWQIDATKLDMMVKVPVIDGEPNYFKKQISDEYILVRFTLNGVVDHFSGARVYVLAKNGDSYLNARLLKKAIETLGVPESIKGDNGKDYISNHFQDTLESLNIEYIAANPYKGSEKGMIERGFKTLQHNYIFENIAGFIGHNTKERQLLEAQHTKKSQRSTTKGTQTNIKGEFLWWWEAERVLDGLINHLFEKQMKEHKRLVDMTQTIPNLDKKLGKRVVRVVGREGVMIHGKRYFSVDMWEKVSIGDRVTVIEDMDDINRAYIHLKDEEFIEIVADTQDSSMSVEEAKEIKKSYKQRVNKEIKKIYKSGKSELEKLSELTKAKVADKSSIDEEVVSRLEELVYTNTKEYQNNEDMLERFMEKVGY